MRGSRGDASQPSLELAACRGGRCQRRHRLDRQPRARRGGVRRVEVARSSPPGSRAWWPAPPTWPPRSTCLSAPSGAAERADIRLEEPKLRLPPSGELQELATIYRERGLP